ncbi:uncharacterized protein A1O9_02527 [Exophiala aquamarina CBS 119918]|uniref:ABC transporter domain-containing protein n=1 Tax=Exophiala aquamarina CBS 119918 TaxID=1182545 RepID=A0A072PNP5_9EURO|nr:uncharacterized protein A1O9_02527 [Exophiala aquamarina CBS 119918]KEF60963.1 hypothetical protein A1O9_02527 [Exophiala aquamarina CBS 119918]
MSSDSEHGLTPPSAPTNVLRTFPAEGDRIPGRTQQLDNECKRTLTRAEDWELTEQVRANYQRNLESFPKERKLGVTWSNLSVTVMNTEASIHDNTLSQFNLPRILKEARQKPPLKTILHGSHGCVKPGEMLLVLGRPGSGCTTFLKLLANRRAGYLSIEGDVWYGSMSHDEAKRYRGQIVINTEEELFYPTLTVGQTTDFATRLKLPFHLPSGAQSREDHQREIREFLLSSMNISHTKDTKVGNEFVRGVSGGERKRVSIIETLASNASVYCWDNSTRGLDASTALGYAKAIRAMTDVLGLSSIVTLYQAGNGIFNLFDKVLVLDGGQQVYYGPMEQAKPFMEELGFLCPRGANVADFLTGVTVPTERQIQPGYENIFPRNAPELIKCYEKSPVYKQMTSQYEFPSSHDAQESTKAFQDSVVHEKDEQLRHSSPLTSGLLTQVKDCVIRQYQIFWGDKATFLIKQVSTIIQALITGSLFYDAPKNSAGLLLKCMTACFRAIGAAFTTFDAASKASGFVIMTVVLYVGYMIPKPAMHPWFIWIFWLDPLAYAFEAVMGNEFHHQIIPCVLDTTMFDILAQRKTEGTINGSILVDGRPLPVSFQRSAGYCEQLDIHEPYATVREALRFSALLRQSRNTSKEEKFRYVDTIIDLLELQDIEDTLIGFPGSGLSIEQRKRVTIGVELVAKPSILIFLDEPTSGLDGQSAYNTVRFLRKLADLGQAVLVTIHQPSAQLFTQFDTLLLLTMGGRTVYFGDIGDNAATAKDYFSRYGASCPPNTNPAEYMIDVVSGHLSQGRDWAKIWLESAECGRVAKELDGIVNEAVAKAPGIHDYGFEFAMPLWSQIMIVTQRMNIALFRNTDYTNNKFALHIANALFNGFSFWMISDSVSDLQLNLFTIFNFIFVAPGVINQLQPLFIARRDIFEAREKKAKMYSWIAFVTGLIISEFPYLVICAIL